MQRKTKLISSPKKRPTARQQRKVKGVWSTDKADKEFSKFIRERDESCKRCRTRDNLTCSHFWMRGHSSTRFDPLNCIALCMDCHMDWEHRKNYEYKQWMVEWLGVDTYNELEHRARSFKNRAEAVAECKAMLEKS